MLTLTEWVEGGGLSSGPGSAPAPGRTEAAPAPANAKCGLRQRQRLRLRSPSCKYVQVSVCGLHTAPGRWRRVLLFPPRLMRPRVVQRERVRRRRRRRRALCHQPYFFSPFLLGPNLAYFVTALAIKPPPFVFMSERTSSATPGGQPASQPRSAYVCRPATRYRTYAATPRRWVVPEGAGSDRAGEEGDEVRYTHSTRAAKRRELNRFAHSEHDHVTTTLWSLSHAPACTILSSATCMWDCRVVPRA